MASQALYLRWRPAIFEDVVGQDHITYTLRNALVGGRVAHAYLFAGPRGTGKTTTARLLAKAVNCLADDPAMRPCNACEHCVAVNEGRFLDLIEIDAASHTGVDDVRDLRDKIAFAPNAGRYKVYIVDEVHRFSGAAFDALLKTLEEPPAHAIFVLATTEIHKVPATILSRCQRFDFRRIPLQDIYDRLAIMVESEGMQAEPAALELIARQATGSLRDAISLLDQLISVPEEVITLALAQAVLGTAAEESIQALVDALLAGDAAAGLDMVNLALDAGADPRQFARQVTEYLRLVLLAQTGGADFVGQMTPQETLAQILAQAEAFPRVALLAAIKTFNEAASDLRGGWQPQLPLELALVESIQKLHEPPPAAAPPAPAPAPAPSVSRRREAAPAPAAPAAASPAQEAGVVTMQHLHARWGDVIGAARENDKAAEALLRSGWLAGIEGDVVFIQMPSSLLRDKIEDAQTRAVIEAALQQVFGRRLVFRCEVGSAHSDQQRDAEALLADDPLLASAVNDLDGEITDIQTEE
jgi:DNA polymerase-3 subunit gamma/tau